MSSSKSPNHLLLEQFLGTEFEFDPQAPAQKEAHFFDGAMFWDVMFNEEERLLFFTADLQEHCQPFRTLEIGIYYDTLKVDDLPGIGEVLSITPLKKEPHPTPFWLTKTQEGRFSLATSI